MTSEPEVVVGNANGAASDERLLDRELEKPDDFETPDDFVITYIKTENKLY